jgi:hypothetical protein
MIPIEKDVESLLDEKEKILFVSRKSVKSSENPRIIYVTNKRLMWVNSQPVGEKKKIIEVPYENISTIKYDKKLISTNIYMKTKDNTDPIKLFVENIKDASQIESYIGRGMKNMLPKSSYSGKKIT